MSVATQPASQGGQAGRTGVFAARRAKARVPGAAGTPAAPAAPFASSAQDPAKRKTYLEWTSSPRNAIKAPWSLHHDEWWRATGFFLASSSARVRTRRVSAKEQVYPRQVSARPVDAAVELATRCGRKISPPSRRDTEVYTQRPTLRLQLGRSTPLRRRFDAVRDAVMLGSKCVAAVRLCMYTCTHADTCLATLQLVAEVFGAH